MLKRLIEFLFPPCCIACGTPNVFVCRKCFGEIPKLPEMCVGKNIYAVYPYGNKTVRQALWMLKFQGIRSIAEIFAEPLLSLSDVILPEERCFLLVPIPTTKPGLRKRGYSQTLLIAKCLEDQSDKKFKICDVLEKYSGVKKQTDVKERKKRAENIRNAFSVKNPDAVIGKNIVLVDDIITTGATAREAVRTLRNAGAESVCFIAIAYQNASQ